MKRTLVLTSALVFLAIIIAFLTTKKPTEIVLNTPTPTPSYIKTTDYLEYDLVPEKYRSIYQSFSLLAKKDFPKIVEGIANTGGVWWVNRDNYRIHINNIPSFELQFACDSDNPVNLVGEISKFVDNLTNMMSDKGYQVNHVSSSDSLSDQKFYDYMRSFENGVNKCQFVANPDCISLDGHSFSNSLTFTCTDQFEKRESAQNAIRKDLGITDNELAITIELEKGNFANVNIHGRRSGHYAIIQKINGKWNQIYAGQESPTCELMQKHNVPKEIYGECYNFAEYNN